MGGHSSNSRTAPSPARCVQLQEHNFKLIILKIGIILYFLLPSFCYSQSNLHYDTSNLINGNGIAFFINSVGKNFGFATFQNNNLHGKFYFIDTLGSYALSGELKCDSNCMNNSSGIKVKYRNSQSPDTLTWILDSSLYLAIFKNTPRTIISTESVIVPQSIAGTHPELNFGFGNPAVVPIGKWQRLDLKNKYVFVEFHFDECGNPTLTKYFNLDGTILNEFKFETRQKGKRQW